MSVQPRSAALHRYVFQICHSFESHDPPVASITLFDSADQEVDCRVRTMLFGESPNFAYDELIATLYLQGVLF